MRLDKWLKVARLIRRRAVAQEACAQGCVRINGRPAKPATPVRAGDALNIELGPRLLQVEVLAVPAGAVPAARAAELYRTVPHAGPEGAAAPEDGGQGTVGIEEGI